MIVSRQREGAQEGSKAGGRDEGTVEARKSVPGTSIPGAIPTARVPLDSDITRVFAAPRPADRSNTKRPVPANATLPARRGPYLERSSLLEIAERPLIIVTGARSSASEQTQVIRRPVSRRSLNSSLKISLKSALKKTWKRDVRRRVVVGAVATAMLLVGWLGFSQLTGSRRGPAAATGTERPGKPDQHASPSRPIVLPVSLGAARPSAVGDEGYDAPSVTGQQGRPGQMTRAEQRHVAATRRAHRRARASSSSAATLAWVDPFAN